VGARTAQRVVLVLRASRAAFIPLLALLCMLATQVLFWHQTSTMLPLPATRREAAREEERDGCEPRGEMRLRAMT